MPFQLFLVDTARVAKTMSIYSWELGPTVLGLIRNARPRISEEYFFGIVPNPVKDHGRNPRANQLSVGEKGVSFQPALTASFSNVVDSMVKEVT